MYVGLARIVLHFPGSSSLKDKRQNLKSIIERTKHRYNISIAEVDNQDLWQLSTLGISYVALTEFQSKKTLNAIRDFIDSIGKAVISEVNIETVKME